MKHRNLGKFLVVAASISMAFSPISALANENPVLKAEESSTATVDTKALLNEAISYANAAKADDSYNNVVPKVKAYFEKKLEDAKKVPDGADVADINKAWSELVDAVHYLDFVGDHTALAAEIAQHTNKVESDYKAGWDAFKTALDEAKEVDGDKNALQADIDAKKDALKNAAAGLQAKDPVVVNKADLKKALDDVNALTGSDYTTETWAALQVAKEAAQSVYGDPNATQEQVDTAKRDLLAAKDALTEAQSTDTSALAAAVLAADEVKDKEADYTPDSWKTFADALKAGQDILDALAADPDSKTQEEVDNAAKALTAAQTALTKKEDPKPVAVDKSALKKALADNADKKEADYTADSWKKFDDAKKAAEAVDKNDKATQNEVDKATNDLIAAAKALAKKPAADEPAKVDKSKLVKALDATKKLSTKNPDGDEQISEDKYKALQDAYKKADEVNKNEKATQDEVDKATAALNDAYDNLDQTIWRVYNPNNGEHLFTANKGEYDMLVSITWHGEGKAWIAPRIGGKNATNMTRLYNPNSGEHHYTATKGEIANLEKIGWKNEGTKWATYVSEKDAENVVAVHRMYNPNAGKDPKTMAGPHHYTLSNEERDALVKIGWNWEHRPEDIFYAKAKAPK